eukprot:CAMPEP_0185621128 /NCGR_PEP_ID=MMETSP0436-20130131/56316_1 /TAXON_ID=626734 ORGANISM="Favella taraikaensis, Strain Fe Narragansett Bay" /NCGR_SAMPLE_ID=MMETSP0436 /ASSEMBLY_ACC=CAM_ASM_000390 /LENGTH=54 /DNA_ID=CAMNT_0028262111 /DNA_START=111 /DNA_END=275 /DNA_ORIENTATION=+
MVMPKTRKSTIVVFGAKRDLNRGKSAAVAEESDEMKTSSSSSSAELPDTANRSG